MLREILENLDETIGNFKEIDYRKLLKKFGVPTASMLTTKDRKEFEKELKKLTKDD